MHTCRSHSFTHTCISIHKITIGERTMANNIQWPRNSNAFLASFAYFFFPGYDIILYKQYIKNAIPLIYEAFVRLQHEPFTESLDKYLNCYINDSGYEASPGYSKNKCSWTISPSNQKRILKSHRIYNVSQNSTDVFGWMAMIFSFSQRF